MEYINRELALKLLGRNSITKHITFSDGVSIYDTIANIPTADVVAVVRCKDCKHYHRYLDRHTNEPSIWGRCKEISMDIDLMANDFCCYGERKETHDNI